MYTNLYQTVLCQNKLKKGVPYQVLVVCPGNFATEHYIKLYQKLEFLGGWGRGGFKLKKPLVGGTHYKLEHNLM